MKKEAFSVMLVFCVLLSISFLGDAYGINESNIKVELTSHSNLKHNGAMEVCGTAVHKDAEKTLIVTVKHGGSFYSTVTGPNDNWCMVIKRWTNDGVIEVGASEFGQKSNIVYKLFMPIDLNN